MKSRTYPRITPAGHARLYIGRANPKFVESVISAITECITGALPEHRPANARKASIAGKVLLNPKKNVATATPALPQRITGRLPILSEIEAWDYE